MPCLLGLKVPSLLLSAAVGRHIRPKRLGFGAIRLSLNRNSPSPPIGLCLCQELIFLYPGSWSLGMRQ